MKVSLLSSVASFVAALFVFVQVAGAASADPATAPLTFPYGRFGETTIYRPVAKPTGVTLFISGDGGWNLGVVDMARHLVELGSVVVGIDIRHYRDQVNRGGAVCQDFSGDFENLSHAVQQRLGLDEYWLPVLVGYSSGATLAYAVAVQSPKGTYGGVLSLGFCPDLDLKQPICRGAGLQYEFDRAQRSDARPSDPGAVKGVTFQPAESNTTPWFALQGDADQVCAPAATRAFVEHTGAATLVPLPNVGHGYSVERNWLPQFVASYRRIANPAAVTPSLADTADLPLVEVPARAAAAPKLRDVFAVLLTGDGGWAGLDQDVASELAERGVPVVALNSLKYFWKARDPDGAARDLQRVIREYGRRWGRSDALLVGYSFGADVLPFLYDRLDADTRSNVRGVALLGLAANASFEFHVAEWIPGRGAEGLPTVPEIERMSTARVLCLHGREERDSPCPALRGAGVHVVAIDGGHHFNGDYGGVVRQILEFAAGGAP